MILNLSAELQTFSFHIREMKKNLQYIYYSREQQKPLVNEAQKYHKGFLTLYFAMSEIGQTHFKNLATFMKCNKL